jgi:membrane protease subunit (stomatin/prohibitin family)
LKVCWNDEKGLCVQCVPKLDQEIAAMQLQAQMGQLQEKIQQQDWTRNINYTDVATGLCPSCHRKSGGGKFCKFCGNPLAANEAMAKFCQNCGTKLGDANFCPECGAPTV